LLIAVIVIPPEKLPEAMRTTGKLLRELRLASNTVVRELTSALDEPYVPPVRAAMTRRPAAQLPPAAATQLAPTAATTSSASAPSAANGASAEAPAASVDSQPQK